MDPQRVENMLVEFEQKFATEELASLSRRVKKRRVVLFFGRAEFSDNSKYVFLQALAQPRGYEVVWCTVYPQLAEKLEKAGLPVHLIGRDLDATIDLFVHAAVAVNCVHPADSLLNSDVLLGCLAGAAQIQLWHGVSVKHLVLQLIPHLGLQEQQWRRHWLSSTESEYVLSTAATFDRFWREVFGVSKMLRAGQPRNAVLTRDARPEELVGAELPDDARAALESARRAILLVPTWQRGQGTAVGSAEFLARLVDFANRNDAQIFLKVHPSYSHTWGSDKSDVSRFHIIHPGVDIYPWLSKFSALVTDYSSIMFDFLLTGKPVLTLDIPPGKHQNFEPDYSLVPDGDFRIDFTPETIHDALSKALFDDTGVEARAAYARTIFETDPAEAPEDVLRLVEQLVERSQRDDVSVWAPGSSLMP